MILLRIRYSNVGPERNAIQARERTLGKHGLLSPPGYIKHSSGARTAFSRAGCIHQTIYPLVNTLVSSKAGCKPLALIRPCMALTQ